MKTLFALLLNVTVAFSSYGQHLNPGTATEKPADIFKNKTSFLNYIYYNLDLLSANYTAYDDHSKVISKGEFLSKAASGDYMFLKLNSADGKLYFKLYKLNGTEKKFYGDLIYAYTQSYKNNYRWVGKKIPAFNFTDINGNRYTSQNTRGKVVVLKCWYIGCQACIEEMPALNNLVHLYSARKDILFVSLAPDTKAKLQSFFKDRRFDYAKVPSENDYMTHVLKICEYPTHFVINKQGVIVNVVNSSDEIKYSLRNDL